MNREIKFRAWLKFEERMEEVAAINFADQEICLYEDGVQGEWRYFVDSILMQYTGIKDKNEVEIYEGDIVKWWGYEVQFGRQVRPERIIYINDYIKDTYKILCITEDTRQTVEVIGNVYEHKHLLGVE